MKQPSPPALERDTNEHSLSLVDRMDPAIGEATSVMGAVLTELLRRSLRGGVLQIGDELQAFVCDRVDATLADRTPAIEQQASEVAGNTARTVAASIASEIAGQEVETLERWTKETTQELASQMVEAERRTQHATAEAARSLASQIEETKKEAHQTTASTAQQLAAHIEEVEKRAVDTTLSTAQKLAGQIEEVDKRAADTTLTTAQQLAGQIEEARQRAEATAHAEMTEQVQDLVLRSRKNSAIWKARFKVLETRETELVKQLADEQSERKTELTAVRTEVQQKTVKLLQRLEQEETERRAMEAKLREVIQQLHQANEALSARVAELEKPRGLGAAFKKLFSRRKEPQPDPENGA